MTEFQKVIEALLAKHNLLEKFRFVATPENYEDFHAHFEMKPYQPLVIERHGDMISVAHYYTQNGDLIADPDVELNYPTWSPTAIQQVYGYRQKFIVRNGHKMVDRGFDREVSSFLAMWGRNIKEQGWIERGQLQVEEEDGPDPSQGIDE